MATEENTDEIEAVIFDIGNVLLRWQPEEWYDRMFGPARRKALFAAIDLHAMNERIDAGGDFREVIYATAEENPLFAKEIRLWHDRWSEIVGAPIARSVRLLHALRARGVPVFALSNFGRDNFALTARQHDFLGAFDRRYISGHMFLTKPDPRIYEEVEADCGIAPGRLLFTDDREENIEAARGRGWQVHHFTGPEGLAERLVTSGLLSAAEAE